jgi:sugar phosphate isomerase/epimerase
MIPAISQVCSLPSPFHQDLADYAAGAARDVELWLGKLETHLAKHSLAETRALLAELEIRPVAASFQGGLLHTQGDARREHWAHFERRLELCRGLAVPVLVVACDVAGPLNSQDLERVAMSLRQAAERAADAGLELALEFQAQATFGNNLQTAAYLVEQAGHPSLGICLDYFHYYRGPSKQEDLGLLVPENLFHVQLADLAGVPREMAADSDRILPGDGDFDFAPLLERLRQIDYRGAVSLELMNPQIWAVPPRSLGEIGMTCLRRLLGQARMA